MGPDKQLAKEKYRGLADGYDRLIGRADRLLRNQPEAVRREAVELLGLQAGDAVVDVGCGTGLSFALIEERIGANGEIVGIELSAEMLAKARERVASAGWRNITLIESAVEDAEIPVQADAAFFHFTHDIMRSPAALENVLRHVKAGGRVVSAGGKWAPWWALPVNAVMWRISRQYITTFEGFRRPWNHLKRYVPDLRVKTVLFGAGYIAWGEASGSSGHGVGDGAS